MIHEEIEVLDIDIREKEIETAGYLCLFSGILFSIFAIASQMLVFVNEFRVWKFLVIEICTLIFATLAFIMIKLWKERTKFSLFACRLNDDIDINYIRKVHKIVDINDHYIVFIYRKDIKYYTIWKTLYSDRGAGEFKNEFKLKKW